MDIDEELIKSLTWMTKSNSQIDGASFDTTNKRRVSVALFHLSLEHQSAIHLLVDNKTWGSAIALIRPQFESYVRGLWYEHCATEDQITAFLDGNEPPRIRTLTNDIEKQDTFSGGYLSKVIDGLWRKFCDYTHGGTIQVKSRNKSDEIAYNYNPDHICGILQASAAIAYSAALEIAKIVDDPEMAINLMELHKELYNEQPQQ